MIVVENIRSGAVFLPNEKMLVPGENDVKEKDWEELREHRAVKTLLAEAILIDKGKGKAQPLQEQLYKLTVDKARFMIDKVDDIKLLKKWSMNDPRQSVREYVLKRIATLQNG